MGKDGVESEFSTWGRLIAFLFLFFICDVMITFSFYIQVLHRFCIPFAAFCDIPRGRPKDAVPGNQKIFQELIMHYLNLIIFSGKTQGLPVELADTPRDSETQEFDIPECDPVNTPDPDIQSALSEPRDFQAADLRSTETDNT